MFEVHDMVGSNSLTEKSIMEYVIDICSNINFDMGAVLLFDIDNTHAAIHEFYKKDSLVLEDDLIDKKYIQSKSFNSSLKKIIEQKKILIRDYSKSSCENTCDPLIEGAKYEIYIPLILIYHMGHKIIGCLYMNSFNTSDINFEYWDSYDPASIIKLILNKYECIYVDYREASLLTDTIHLFSEIMYEKDHSLILHSYNVAWWCLSLAQTMSLNEGEIKKLFNAAILHDIGKIYIDTGLLNKPTSLSPNEYEEAKKHALYSNYIVKDHFKYISGYENINNIIKYHHERYDGSGYPYKLKNDEIPVLSRILAISDAVDAMISGRSYKPPKTTAQSIH